MVLLFVIPLNVDINWPQEFWIKQSIFLFILILFYNANTYLFVQRLLFKDKLWFYIIVVVISVAAILVTMQVIEHSLNLRELMHKAIRPNKPYEPKVEWFRFDFFALLISLLVFGLSTSISLFRKGQKDALIRNELEKQKVSSELSFLKAQINPHFYFNTLNNIYALTGINANSAKEAIHKLSKMMRYVLYETEKEKTLLSQEISFIENYIEIMKLRLTE
jgi:sensor histidine kinase YesM